MDENNIYNEYTPAEENKPIIEPQVTEAEQEQVIEAEVVAEVEAEQKEAPHSDSQYRIKYPITEEKSKKKKKVTGWIVAVIIIVVLAVLAVAAGIASYFKKGIIKPVEYHAMPGGSITFSEANPSEEVAKSALMAVVNIESQTGFEGFFGYSFGNSAGSGVVIREDGYIITSAQLAENESEIAVELQDGKNVVARVLDIDHVNGIALLKVDTTGLDTITIGDSSTVAVGDRVAVVGNRINSGLTNPVTLGYICGVNNGVGLESGSYINLFQVDASAIAGSVGGLVLNSKGELIGISNGIISNSSNDIGLVTPINDLRQLIGEIVSVNVGSAGIDLRIGISGKDESYGVSVTMVGEGTPAEAAGIKVDDLVVKVDGETVTSIAKINEIKNRHVKGDTLVVTVYREGEMIDLNVIL